MAARKRRTQKEIFVDSLRDYSGGEECPVGNQAFRNHLNWEQGKYERVKQELIGEGRVIQGPGQGGTVRLPKSESKAARVFVSYSHHDKQLKTELLKHLMPLKRLKVIETWSDLEIKGGDEWNKEISGKLEEADIILLLISVDFINSSYCYDVELRHAIERHDKGQTRIIPVILRPCMWSHTPFAKFQALPSEAKAVITWDSVDEAFSDVSTKLFDIAKELKTA